MRINVGCGMSPTAGWKNFDNSPSIFLGKARFISTALRLLGAVGTEQQRFIDFCKLNNIQFADVRKRIPLADGSVEVVYTSHMLEHLERGDAKLFLKEARRVLQVDGILRIAVPDLMYYAANYVQDHKLEDFMYWTNLTAPRRSCIVDKAKYLLIGDRHHQWMYDGPHLCWFLSECGFISPQIMPAGSTSIPSPGALDLHERSPASVFVEARKG